MSEKSICVSTAPIASIISAANRFALAPQGSAGNPLSLPTLGFGFGVNKLAKPLNLREIDFSIDEGAPGKLARFGRTQTPGLDPAPQQSPKRLRDRRLHATRSDLPR